MSKLPHFLWMASITTNQHFLIGNYSTENFFYQLKSCVLLSKITTTIRLFSDPLSIPVEEYSKYFFPLLGSIALHIFNLVESLIPCWFHICLVILPKAMLDSYMRETTSSTILSELFNIFPNYVKQTGILVLSMDMKRSVDFLWWAGWYTIYFPWMHWLVQSWLQQCKKVNSFHEQQTNQSQNQNQSRRLQAGGAEGVSW